MSGLAKIYPVNKLKSQGFDLTYRSYRSGYVNPKCSQCNVMVINNVATHEPGCPNIVHECEYCETLLPLGQRICGSCMEEYFE